MLDETDRLFNSMASSEEHKYLTRGSQGPPTYLPRVNAYLPELQGAFGMYTPKVESAEGFARNVRSGIGIVSQSRNALQSIEETLGRELVRYQAVLDDHPLDPENPNYNAWAMEVVGKISRNREFCELAYQHVHALLQEVEGNGPKQEPRA